jgi:hypothetical protein
MLSGPSHRGLARRPERRAVVAALALVLLAGGRAAAPAAAAAPTRAAPPPICARVHRQYTRLAQTAKQAKVAFARAHALQTRLLRAGRTQLAHRLDARLAHLRQVIAALAARVAAISARVQTICPERPPTVPTLPTV